ncbi:MAG: PKD domain-containing protein [Saprospiraceae bacterium]|nr:PKD domain-containing protein [Saprospiraceae bacterium]
MKFQYPLLFMLILSQISNVYTQTNVSFSANQTQVCASALIEFYDNTTSANPIVAWEWTRNGTIVANQQNPFLFFSSPGNYDICLTTTDNVGNSVTHCENSFIVVNSLPQVNFSIDSSMGCVPYTVSFTDLSTAGSGAITSWLWDFGDGNLDPQNQNPSHTYTVAGNFDVTLVVTDINGCSESLLINDTVNIVDPPFAAISTNGFSSSCDFPRTVTFQATSASTSGQTYVWEFGDGDTATGQTVSHIYTSAGCYTPTLTVTSALGNCTYTRVTNNCINVAPPPVADFSLGSPIGCSIPHTTSITNNSTNATTYTWTLGDGNSLGGSISSYTYNSYSTLFTPDGFFSIKLIAYNNTGCQSSHTEVVQVSDLQAEFDYSVLSSCAPTAEVSVQTMYTGGTPYFETGIQWDWDFGDGQQSTGMIANNIYADSGTYMINLTATDTLGCTITLEDSVDIGITPVIDSLYLTQDTLCHSDSTLLMAWGPDYIDEWYWNFGSTGATGDSVYVSFADSGSVSGNLVATFNGCQGSIPVGEVFVELPLADLVKTVRCGSFTVDFENISAGADQWFWDFGDPTTTSDTSSTLWDATYTYPDTGIYYAYLWVYNESTGCSDSFECKLEIYPVIADFLVQTTVCAPDTISAINLSTGAASYYWDIDQMGNYPLSPDTLHAELVFGVEAYDTITLIAWDEFGCADTVQKPIIVSQIFPNIHADQLVGCLPFQPTLTDSSISGISPIVAWDWGAFGTSSSISPTLTNSGSNVITMEVTNDLGCQENTFILIGVEYANAMFNTAADVCLGDVTGFLGYPSSGTSPLTYTWDFGDGTVPTIGGSNILHNYADAGIYSPCLVVTSPAGCVDTFCRNNHIEVHDPVADFTQDTTYTSCPPLEVNFNTLSTGANQWYWEFGNGSISTLENPSHIYSDVGIYDVTLTVTAIPGCSHTVTLDSLIEIEGPYGVFNSIPLDTCAPIEMRFEGEAYGTVSYTWLYGDGGIGVHMSSDTVDTINYVYTIPGVYVPELILDDGFGCILSFEGAPINIDGIPDTELLVSDSILCVGEQAIFDIDPQGNYTYTWAFEGGSVDTSFLANPTVVYSDTGLLDVSLILSNGSCIDTFFRQDWLSIHGLPNAAFSPAWIDTCGVASNSFMDLSSSDYETIHQWNWDFGDGSTSLLQNPNHFFSTVDSFQISLIVETTSECRDTSSNWIHVYPIPTVSIAAVSPVCEGDSLQLQATGQGTPVWTSNIPLSDLNIANPVAYPTTTDDAIVEYTNVFGCQASDTVQIVWNPLPNIQALGDTICWGDAANLNAVGGQTYVWQSAVNLSDPNSANPQTSPLQNTMYWVEGTDVHGCVNTDSTIVIVHALPTPQITSSNSMFCEGDSLELEATGGIIINWQTDAFSEQINANTALVYPTNSQYFYVEVMDANTCSNQDSIWVEITPIINNALLEDLYICKDAAFTLGLNSGNQATWQGVNLSCTTCPNPVASPIVTSSYYVYFVTTEGCPTSDSLTIYVLDTAQINAGVGTILCEGESYSFEGEGAQGWPFQWLANGIVIEDQDTEILVTPNSSTIYTWQVGEGDCIVQDQVTLEVIPKTDLLVRDTFACEQQGIRLRNTSSTDHLTNLVWVPNKGTDTLYGEAPIVMADLAPIMYTVSAFDGHCPINSASFSVNLRPSPSANLNKKFTFAREGTTVDLRVLNPAITSFNWSPPQAVNCPTCANVEHIIEDDIVLYVDIEDEYGCIGQDSVQIKEDNRCGAHSVFIPNAFTPNGDGANDKIQIISNKITEIESFMIFNRWGEKVFETNDRAVFWDGIYKGKHLPTDVYVYVLNFPCPDTGEPTQLTGDITLLR